MVEGLPFRVPKEILIVGISCHTQDPNFCPQHTRKGNMLKPTGSANAQLTWEPLHLLPSAEPRQLQGTGTPRKSQISP